MICLAIGLNPALESCGAAIVAVLLDQLDEIAAGLTGAVEVLPVVGRAAEGGLKGQFKRGRLPAGQACRDDNLCYRRAPGDRGVDQPARAVEVLGYVAAKRRGGTGAMQGEVDGAPLQEHARGSVIDRVNRVTVAHRRPWQVRA